MIQNAYLTEWGIGAPWPTATQIEQDLILSRLIVEIAKHPLLSRELAFRGGTCLHKLHLPSSYRYSEDLDYVRTNTEPRLGDVFDALREIAIDGVGLREHRRSFPTEQSDVACIWFDGDPTNEQGRIRVKVEINTAETDPFRERVARPYAVSSRWWSGSVKVPTFALDELLATKLRALYQRSKGRDLFDLWVALDTSSVDAEQIIGGLGHYMRGETFSYRQLHNNLQGKLADHDFLDDLSRLVTEPHAGYEPHAAAELVMKHIGARLRNAPEPPSGERGDEGPQTG